MQKQKPVTKWLWGLVPLILIAVGALVFFTAKTSPTGENEWVTITKAHFLGDADAQYVTALTYDVRKDGVNDELKAISWYEKAAAKSHAGAMIALADIYDARTDETSRTKAAHWLSEAARLGNPRAQFRLAHYYARGWGGLPFDATKVASLLNQSADAGFGPALTRYGVELKNRDQVAEAIPWFQKAAAQGDADALYHLGEIYSDKKNGELINVIKAVTYFEEAANMGHVKSQLKYSYLCFAGQGVPRDAVEAYKWAEIASLAKDKTDHADATYVRGYLRTKISLAQQKDGEARARAWLALNIPPRLAGEGDRPA